MQLTDEAIEVLTHPFDGFVEVADFRPVAEFHRTAESHPWLPSNGPLLQAWQVDLSLPVAL